MLRSLGLGLLGEGLCPAPSRAENAVHGTTEVQDRELGTRQNL